MKFNCEVILRKEEFKIFWTAEYEVIQIKDDKIELMVMSDQIRHVIFSLFELRSTGRMKIYLVEEDDDISVTGIDDIELLTVQLQRLTTLVGAKSIARAITLHNLHYIN